MKKITQRLDLVLVLTLVAALVLNTYNIWQDGAANQYYLAAVKSMTQSFHNFFYASFDPSGFVTVDKPPVVLWIQTIFALLFGVHTWSVILPQALAGAGSVYLLYKMVQPTFEDGAARIAAIVMALTPIAAAVSRTNNIDSLLVFTLLLGTWCLMKSLKSGKLLWLIFAFGLIGLGFNMKMLQAFMVLPAFIVMYAVAARKSVKKRILSLILSMFVLASVSLSWALVVDYASEDNRPYVGSSQTNSVLELAFGYNGTERLLGQTTGNARAGMGGFGEQGSVQASKNISIPDDSESDDAQGTPPSMNGNNQPPQMPQNQGDGGPPGNNNSRGPQGSVGPGGSQSMNMFGTGEAGPLRLFQSALSGQISWMLPFALMGILAVALTAFRERRKKEWQEAVFWTAWLVPVAGFFSVAGFFHHYYLIMLAPPIAALCGIGWSAMYRLYKERNDWKSYLLPAAVGVTVIFQTYILGSYTEQIGSVWMYTLGIVGVILTVAFVILKSHDIARKRLSIISLCILLIAPMYWSVTPILYGGNSVLPESGPQLSNSMNGGGMFSSNVNSELLSYLRENNTGEEYLFATFTTVTAAPYIIDANESVMALGGFNGTDPILTTSELEGLVKKGKVKYFLLSGDNSGNSELVKWIKIHGVEISQEHYLSEEDQGKNNLGMDRGFGSRNQEALYKIEI